MKSVTVTMSPERVESKPTTKKEKEKWAKEVGRSPAIDLTIEVLAHTICIEKFSFCHVTCHNQWINIKNFKQSQLIVVDVDGNLSPQEALDRLQRLDLPNPNIIYRTLSDPTSSELSISEKLNQTKKFRMIFVLDQPIHDFRTYELLVKHGMYIIFPESDHVGVTQKWLPGKENIYMDTESYLSPTNLMCIADLLKTEKVGDRQRKNRLIKKYLNAPPNIFHNAENAHAPKTANCYSIYREFSENGTKIRGFDWVGAAQEFQVFGDFYYKRRKITNPELLGLYSGMRRIEGGSLLWKRLVTENELINDRHLSIADWFNVVIGKGDNPWEQRIEDYAPNDPTIYERLTDFHFKRGRHAFKLKDVKEMSLEEAEKKLEAFMIEAMSPESTGTYLCKGATALGKTEYYVKHISEGCIVAVPNHKLKDEIVNRLSQAGKSFLYLPDYPDLPEPIMKDLNKYYSVGDQVGAARFLRRMARGLNAIHHGLTTEEAWKVQRRLMEYFKLIEQSKSTTLPIIITHKRILFTTFPNHHTLIIDEDIIPTIFEMGSFTTKDLRILIEALKKSDCDTKDFMVLEGLLSDVTSNSQLLRHVQSTSQGRREIFENYEDLTRVVYEMADEFEGQVLPFFKCCHYIVELKDRNDPKGEKVIHYVIDYRDHFPYDKRIVMLSATTAEFLCRRVFRNVHWVDISHVHHVGTRIQFSDKSWSRSSIRSKHYKPYLLLLNELYPSMPKITYKRYRNLFTNPATYTDGSGVEHDISIENCSGCDALKGEDIVVVGNGHIPTHIYRLMAAALDIEFTADDFDLSEQWVVHNGFKFRFQTYEHEGLRSIQFYFVESMLTQAAGRNRSLREDATCYLFSGYPLPGFDQRFIDSLAGQITSSTSMYPTSGSIAC